MPTAERRNLCLASAYNIILVSCRLAAIAAPGEAGIVFLCMYVCVSALAETEKRLTRTWYNLAALCVVAFPRSVLVTLRL